MINIIDNSLCCGCSACVQRCPKQCIVLVEDAEGFFYPHVDEKECIDCGLCEKVCPWLNRDEPLHPLQTLAVKNCNEEERMRSSSGGVFVALAKATLDKGGVVFGAIFDEDWEVKHTWADTLEGVQAMMSSKYLQSRIEQTYLEAERFLKEGREVLFSGTPCQISGLKRFLRKEYMNLLAVDFLCHGVPSPGVWRRYLKELSEQTARRAAAGKNTVLSSSLNDLPVITGIAFRDKTLHGWKKFSFVVRGRSAYKADQNSVLLSGIHIENPFMKGFLANIYLRPSCYDCKCKCGRSHSDLTIADFWGIDRLMPEFDDDQGVSLVLVNSHKGEEYLGSLDMEIYTSDIETVCTNNLAYCTSAYKHPKREKFYRSFSKGESVSSIVALCLKIPFYIKIIRFFKRMVWICITIVTVRTNNRQRII